jgi:hypothetical protein
MIISICVSTRARALHSQPQDKNFSSQQTGKLSNATAVATTSGVMIQWRSTLDADNLGFNIYRLTAEARVRVNREIIPGAVFVANRQTLPSDSHLYAWLDRGGSASAGYYIETVSLEGVTKLDERAIAVTSKSNAVLNAASGNSATSDGDASPAQKSYPTAAAEILSPNGPIENQWAIAARPALKISIKNDGWYRVTQQDMAGAGFNPAVDIRNLRLFAEGQEVAINTSQAIGAFGSSDYIEFYGSGLDVPTSDTRIYYLIADTIPGKRVGGELHLDSGAGAPPQPVAIPTVTVTIRPTWFGFIWSFLNLPDRGPHDGRQKIAATPERARELRIPSEPKTLNEPVPTSETAIQAATAVTFSAPVPAAHETINVNKPDEPSRLPEAFLPPLRAKKEAAPKKPKRRKKSRRKYNHAEIINTIAPASFDYTVEREDNFLYFVNVLNGEAENFFGQVIARPTLPAIQTINVPNPAASAAEPARLEIALQGVNQVPHQVEVQFNNVVLGTMNYSGLEHPVQIFDLPVSQLLNGSNTLKFTPAVSGDVSLIDYVRITYPHAFQADAGALKFNLRGTQSLKVDGFSSSQIRLIDYTDPYSVNLSSPLAESSALGYAITVPPSSPRSKAQRLLYAIPEGQFVQPAALTLNQPSTLNAAANGADFLIVAHKSIIPSLPPLVTARQNRFTVSVVDIEDIYDEFGYGVHGPDAIKEFLSFATTHWSIAPRYVIFAGDASYDPRNYMGLGDLDLVPTKLVDATYDETASDDWLADFDNDGAADIALGRLPVGSASDASLVISKIVNFTPAVPQAAMLIADDPGTPPQWDFETASDDVQALLPASMTVQRVNVRTEPSPAQATANIIDGFNQGRAVVNYSGHGNVDVWSGASIFTSANASALTNGNKLPFVIVMDCLNGYFHDPNLLSLSEAFLLAPNGGAVAAFASSGLTSTPGQRQMELQLYSSLYGGQSIAVGDAIKTAKAATQDVDVRRTWIYFGDPSIKIR